VIVGLGVIGGSFAMALKQAGYRKVYGIDTDPSTLQKAEDAGLVQKGFLSGEAVLPDADLIMLSIYPRQVKAFVEQNKPFFKEGAVLTDATGIKGMLMQELSDTIPPSVDFVFGHPMAGREKKGIDFATDRVFQGANYIITPIEKNKPENLDLVEKLAYEMGFGRVRRISPAFHDEIIGFTSQLPHAMAVALINSDIEGRDTGSFIGDSYRDLTRIANINGELWSELFLGNKNNLLKALNNFEIELDMIKKAIHEDDKDALIAFFEKSSKRREKLNR